MTCLHLPSEPATCRYFDPDSYSDYQAVLQMLVSESVNRWMEEVGDITWEEYQHWARVEDKVSYLFAITDPDQVVGFVYYYCKADELERINRLLARHPLKDSPPDSNYLEISFAKTNAPTPSGLISSAVRQTCLQLRNLYHTQFHQPLTILAFIDPQNQPARRLVENCGFEIIDSIKYNPQDSQDDLVYQLIWLKLEQIVNNRSAGHQPINQF